MLMSSLIHVTELHDGQVLIGPKDGSDNITGQVSNLVTSMPKASVTFNVAVIIEF